MSKRIILISLILGIFCLGNAYKGYSYSFSCGSGAVGTSATASSGTMPVNLSTLSGEESLEPVQIGRVVKGDKPATVYIGKVARESANVSLSSYNSAAVTGFTEIVPDLYVADQAVEETATTGVEAGVEPDSGDSVDDYEIDQDLSGYTEFTQDETGEPSVEPEVTEEDTPVDNKEPAEEEQVGNAVAEETPLEITFPEDTSVLFTDVLEFDILISDPDSGVILNITVDGRSLTEDVLPASVNTEEIDGGYNITFTPEKDGYAAESTVEYVFTVTASDGKGEEVTESFTVTVDPVITETEEEDAGGKVVDEVIPDEEAESESIAKLSENMYSYYQVLESSEGGIYELQETLVEDDQELSDIVPGGEFSVTVITQGVIEAFVNSGEIGAEGIPSVFIVDNGDNSSFGAVYYIKDESSELDTGIYLEKAFVSSCIDEGIIQVPEAESDKGECTEVSVENVSGIVERLIKAVNKALDDGILVASDEIVDEEPTTEEQKAENNLPEITSFPEDSTITSADVTEFDVSFSDVDGDNVAVELAVKINGEVLDGLPESVEVVEKEGGYNIAFSPEADGYAVEEAAEYEFTVTVSDGIGEAVTESFTVTVEPVVVEEPVDEEPTTEDVVTEPTAEEQKAENNLPVITSFPKGEYLVAGETRDWKVLVEDPDGDTVTLKSLTVTVNDQVLDSLPESVEVVEVEGGCDIKFNPEVDGYEPGENVFYEFTVTFIDSNGGEITESMTTTVYFY